LGGDGAIAPALRESSSLGCDAPTRSAGTANCLLWTRFREAVRWWAVVDL